MRLREEKRKILEAQREARRLHVIEARKEQPDFSENMLKEINCESLSLFYMRAKKDFVDFLDIFNLDEENIIDRKILNADGKHP